MKERILIVDDESGVRSALSGVLRDEGYTVDAVDSGEACLDRAIRQTFDVMPIRESSLSRFMETAVLTGDYRDIRRFIYKLETRPEFAVIENVDLSQNENETSRRITVTLQIATYFRTGGDGD